MAKEIIVEFSGWVTMDPERVNFIYCGQNKLQNITGVEWLALTPEQRSEYVLESVSDCINDALDGAFDTIDVMEGDDDAD